VFGDALWGCWGVLNRCETHIAGGSDEALREVRKKTHGSALGWKVPKRKRGEGKKKGTHAKEGSQGRRNE